jgi:hypothetical protein
MLQAADPAARRFELYQAALSAARDNCGLRRVRRTHRTKRTSRDMSRTCLVAPMAADNRTGQDTPLKGCPLSGVCQGGED